MITAIAISIALLGRNVSAERDSLKRAISEFNRFEHAHYTLTKQASFNLGGLYYYSNEDGAVLIAGKNGLVEVQKNRFVFTRITWPQQGNVNYLRRSPDHKSIVIGDVERLAYIYNKGRWSKLINIASAFFLPDGRLALVRDFLEPTKKLPKDFPINAVFLPMGSLDVAGWSSRLLDDRHDKTKLSVTRGKKTQAITIPTRQELDWPGLHFSPTKDGGMLFQCAARVPEILYGIAFDFHHNRTYPLNTSGVMYDGWSTGPQSLMVACGDSKGKGHNYLQTSHAIHLTEWKSDWTPIWSPAGGTVFFKHEKGQTHLALVK